MNRLFLALAIAFPLASFAETPADQAVRRIQELGGRVRYWDADSQDLEIDWRFAVDGFAVVGLAVDDAQRPAVGAPT